MKTSLDIDIEYDAGVDYSKSDITDFSYDVFIEIDHELISAQLEVAIKDGKFLIVNSVDFFHVFDHDGELKSKHTDINNITILLKSIPNLYKHVVEQAFERYEDENDN